MAMNPKSATLPADLRHTTSNAESKESGGFFSRLKKRFRYAGLKFNFFDSLLKLASSVFLAHMSYMYAQDEL